MGIVAGGETPEIADVNDGEVSAHVAGVYLSELQRLVVDQPNGVRAGQAKLRIRRNLYRDLAVGALADPGGVEIADQLAGAKGAVDAHHLQGDRFLGGRGRSGGRGRGGGLFAAGRGRGGSRRLRLPAASARGDYRHQQGHGGRGEHRSPRQESGCNLTQSA